MSEIISRPPISPNTIKQPRVVSIKIVSKMWVCGCTQRLDSHFYMSASLVSNSSGCVKLSSARSNKGVYITLRLDGIHKSEDTPIFAEVYSQPSKVSLLGISASNHLPKVTQLMAWLPGFWQQPPHCQVQAEVQGLFAFRIFSRPQATHLV